MKFYIQKCTGLTSSVVLHPLPSVRLSMTTQLLPAREANQQGRWKIEYQHPCTYALKERSCHSVLKSSEVLDCKPHLRIKYCNSCISSHVGPQASSKIRHTVFLIYRTYRITGHTGGLNSTYSFTVDPAFVWTQRLFGARRLWTKVGFVISDSLVFLLFIHKVQWIKVKFSKH